MMKEIQLFIYFYMKSLGELSTEFHQVSTCFKAQRLFINQTLSLEVESMLRRSVRTLNLSSSFHFQFLTNHTSLSILYYYLVYLHVQQF